MRLRPFDSNAPIFNPQKWLNSFFQYFPFGPLFILLNLWPCTYSPHQNHIHRHFRKRSLFICFWQKSIHVFSEDLHCFWILNDPCSHEGIILLTFLCPSFDYRSTSLTSTSPTLHHHIAYTCANFLLKQCPDKWRTYICLILHAYYVFFPHFLDSKFLHSLSWA